MLGNLPLGMTHANLLNAVVDLAECEKGVSRAAVASTRQSPLGVGDCAS